MKDSEKAIIFGKRIAKKQKLNIGKISYHEYVDTRKKRIFSKEFNRLINKR